MPTPFFLWFYLGKLKIWRFHIRCPNCRSVIVFRTDPENKDYEICSGGTRSFRSAYVRARNDEAQEARDEEIEANNPMKLLEDRTFASKRELEDVELLEDLQELHQRPDQTDAGSLLRGRHLNEVEKIKRKIKEEQREDERELLAMLKKQKQVELVDEENDSMDIMKPKMLIRITEEGMKSGSSLESLKTTSSGGSDRPGKGSGKKNGFAVPAPKLNIFGVKRKNPLIKTKTVVTKKPALVAAYSDSSSDSE